MNMVLNQRVPKEAADLQITKTIKTSQAVLFSMELQ
jgi:hypothetical protein